MRSRLRALGALECRAYEIDAARLAGDEPLGSREKICAVEIFGASRIDILR